jgi:hypothetical protein
VFGWGRSEVLSAGDHRGRYSALDSARKAIAGDCLRVGDPRSWTATCSRNRHDWHRARLDEFDQCAFADSHMPTHVHKLDSALSDQAPNESRPSIQQLASLIHR